MRFIFKIPGTIQKEEPKSPTETRLCDYIARNNILFQGNYLGSVIDGRIGVSKRPFVISQTSAERKLLEKQIFLGTLYTPNNDWSQPLIGVMSETELHAYTPSVITVGKEGLIMGLKEKVLEAYVGNSVQPITSEFQQFTDLIAFLKVESKTTFHFKKYESSWHGRENFAGINMVGRSEPIAVSEYVLRMTEK